MGQKINELEKLANKENLNLRRSREALIKKIPVPIEVTTKGLVAKLSTVDYSGTIIGGLSIDYDAKETLSKTSFPLNNIKDHQVKYLMFKYELGGIAFFLIHFKKVYPNKMFVTPVTFINHYFEEALFNEGRKSIPLKDFNENWLTTMDNYLTKVKEMINDLRSNKRCIPSTKK